jgi:hypothetical protein
MAPTVKVLTLALLACAAIASADPGSYYTYINMSGTDNALRAQLQVLVSTNKKFQTYSQVWTAFRVTGKYLPGYDRCDSTTQIADIYSTKCWAKSQQCGTFSKEGDCYNREHMWPKSWFGGSASDESSPNGPSKGAYTDLFELW